jgi:hypothetical protein
MVPAVSIGRHAERLAALEKSLVDSPGAATPAARRAALLGEGEGALQGYLGLVRDSAYRVTPEQLEALRATHSDDALFELTLCAAHGAARRRLEAGLAALDGAFGEEP